MARPIVEKPSGWRAVTVSVTVWPLRSDARARLPRVSVKVRLPAATPLRVVLRSVRDLALAFLRVATVMVRSARSGRSTATPNFPVRRTA